MENQQTTNLDDLWSSSDGAPKFEPVSPGRYHAEVSAATLEEGKDGRPNFVKFELTITDAGSFTNRKLWVNNNVDPRGIPHIITTLAKLGIEKPAKIEQIPDALETALGKRVAVNVVNKPKNDGSGGVWVNTYIEEEIVTGQEFTEDDVPF